MSVINGEIPLRTAMVPALAECAAMAINGKGMPKLIKPRSISGLKFSLMSLICFGLIKIRARNPEEINNRNVTCIPG